MRKVREIIKLIVSLVAYPMLKRRIRFNIMTSTETIDYIINHKVSVSRFGDGEYYIMSDKHSNFQINDEVLKKRLIEVLTVPVSNHLVCLPYTFISLKPYRKTTRRIWRNFIVFNNDLIHCMTPSHTLYGDALFTRFYMIMRNKSKALESVVAFKQLWHGKNICVVEGYYTKFGIGNDLLDACADVTRILCPPTNAFSKYDDILNCITTKIPKTTLILCALGMTATVLAYDLSKLGYMAIDIGHLDIEYEWAMISAKDKSPIKGKSVNELNMNIPADDATTLFVDNVSIYKI